MSQVAFSESGLAERIPEVAALRRRRLGAARRLLMLGGIAAVALSVTTLWLGGGQVVSIDDAYVRAAKEVLSTDVSGIVASVSVHEGQLVTPGEVLLRLDPQPFEIAVQAAQARLGSTAARLNAEKLDYQRMLREVAVKQAQVESDEADYNRFAGLVKNGGVTRAEFETAHWRLIADRQAVEALQVGAAARLARLGGTPEAEVATLPDYLDAKAQVDEAQRRLDHTAIHAPFSGVVTEVETVQPGMYLAAASAAFGLVSRDNLWVEANPKETELTHVRVGNPVAISVDTYPGLTWHGEVQSIAPNSGSEFSVLPAQNTSGNWVKVVQRIPLRIKVLHHQGDPELRAGMSVVAEIDTGHRRRWRDLF